MSENIEKMLHHVPNCVNIPIDGVLSVEASKMAKKQNKKPIGGPKPEPYRGGLTIFPDLDGAMDRAVSEFIMLVLYKAAGKPVDYEEIVDILDKIETVDLPQIQNLEERLSMSAPRLRRFIRKLDIDGKFRIFCAAERDALKARGKAEERIRKKLEAKAKKGRAGKSAKNI